MTGMTPKTRAELHASAVALAQQYQIVKYNSQLFIPVDWSTQLVDDTPPDPLETVWLPMRNNEVLDFANTRGQIIFQSPTELTNFTFMLKQQATKPARTEITELFVKTDSGLKVLDGKGQLIKPTGEFIPNLLSPMLNPDAVEKQRIFDVLTEWLGDKEPADSLLFHIATALAPGWSAAKLILLLGKGRNGKSTLLRMIEALLGVPNVSHVTRQQMATREPAIVDLNNKLANIVFDAASEYIKDSSVEKTLVVGERIGVRLLYESTNTDVITNALFLEGMNEEPKVRDRTNALQRRLVRFYFGKEYPLNREFEELMLSEKSLGAFLSLLLDHYVQKNEAAEKLALVQASYDLQVEMLVMNSKPFQWLQTRLEDDPDVAVKYIGMTAEDVTAQFHAWLLTENGDFSSVDARRMLNELFVMERRSFRSGKKVGKRWEITALQPDAQRLVEKMQEGDDDGAVLDSSALVDD